jgi:tRNA pseudouridine55 synthase
LNDGLLLLNKAAGITSFEALTPVKKALCTGKVGHTGSLDKFADGLLVILTGKALKLTSYLTNCDKRYEAVMRLGSETDTLDPEGLVTACAPIPAKDTLETVIRHFQGEMAQIPPVYSAIHINGERAHKLARGGAVVEMKPRPVNIYELTLLGYEPPLAKLGVHCSAGTYIRAIARDIAIEAGSRAHLIQLTRTQVGGFSLADALTLNCPPDSASADIANALRPIDRGIFYKLSIPVCEVDAECAAALRQGRRARIELPPDDPSPRVAVFCRSSFIALLEKTTSAAANNGSGWRYVFVF